jgi:hypothetical protein
MIRQSDTQIILKEAKSEISTSPRQCQGYEITTETEIRIHVAGTFGRRTLKVVGFTSPKVWEVYTSNGYEGEGCITDCETVLLKQSNPDAFDFMPITDVVGIMRMNEETK